MISWFTYNLIGWPPTLIRLDLALALLSAHLLGDFVFQTAQIVKEKKRFPVLALHAAIIAILSYIFIGHWTSYIIPVIIWGSHALIDAIKVRLRGGATLFIVDQLAHLAVIAALVTAGSFFGSVSLWTFLFGKNVWIVLTFLCGLILTVRVGGLLVGFWVQPYLDEIRSFAPLPTAVFKPVRGLTNGGRLIGQWERALIFLFIGLGQPGSIGFLVAAKSIFRFGELKERENRMEAEYITIGTLMSFGWAIAVSYATWWGIHKILAM